MSLRSELFRILKLEMEKPARFELRAEMTAEQVLMHKRALKAAQMRRYRAKKAKA